MLVSSRIREGERLEIRLEGQVRSCRLGLLVADPSLNCLTWAGKIGSGRSSSEQQKDGGSSAWKVVPGASGAGRSLIPAPWKGAASLGSNWKKFQGGALAQLLSQSDMTRKILKGDGHGETQPQALKGIDHWESGTCRGPTVNGLQGYVQRGERELHRTENESQNSGNDMITFSGSQYNDLFSFLSLLNVV